MASKVFIAAKPVEAWGLDSNYKHLYLIFDEDGVATTTDDQIILRGGTTIEKPTNTNSFITNRLNEVHNITSPPGNIELEIERQFDASLDGFQPGDATAAARHYTTVNPPPGMTVEEFWDKLVLEAESMLSGDSDGDFDGREVTAAPYTAVLGTAGLNSNSIVASLLAATGVDIYANLPKDGGDDGSVRLTAEHFPQLDNLLVGNGTDTITVADGTTKYVVDYGTGDTTVVVDGSQLSGVFNALQTLTLKADASLLTTDIVDLQNVTAADVGFKRLANGDLQVLLPGDQLFGLTVAPSLVLEGQFTGNIKFSGIKIGATTYSLNDSLPFPVGGIVRPDGSGGFIGFEEGTFASVETWTTSSTISVTGPNLSSLLAVDIAGTPTVSFGNGLELELDPLSDVTLEADPEAETPKELILSYLDQLGLEMTESELEEANFDHLYPEQTPFNATGTVQQTSSSSANFFFNLPAAGAIVEGEDLVTIQTGVDGLGNPVYGQVAPTNILKATGDLSRDAITDIDVLQVSGTVSLTESQFNGFGEYQGILTGMLGPNSFSLIASDGGTFDASSINIHGSSILEKLSASSWSGTTLIGSDQDGQVLEASLFGDDTLQAGDGNDAKMVAGLGVNTLIGASGGGNIFSTPNGLAEGSVLDGNGSDNRLEGNGDITGASISGIQTLEFAGDLKLTASQFNAFSAVEGTGTLRAATTGTYDWSGSTADIRTAYAQSAEGVTLVANENIETMYASESGDDTLTATAGSEGRTLDARNSTGAVTMTVGNADDNIIYAGFGINTITMGDGDDNMVIANNGLASGSSIDSSSVTARLQVNGDISGATITGVPIIYIDDAVTLTAAQLGNFDTIANAAFDPSTVTINAASAGTYSLAGKTINNIDRVVLVGSSGADTLTGSSSGSAFGDDIISGGGGNDTINGEIGADILVGGDDADTLNGGYGDDYITGDAGNDTINGNDDADTLEGGAGDDTISGGAGTDTLAYATASSAVTVDLGVGTAQNTGGAGTDTISGFENLIGSAFNDTLTGNSGANVIDGLEGNDTISGGGGADTLYGSAGNDTVGGGGGDDTLYGGDGDDTLNGNGDNDTVYGGEGADTINGNDGNDTLYGDAGNDTIRGGNGTDTIYGGDGDDIIQIFSGEVPSGESVDGENGTDRLVVGSNSMNPSSMTVSNMEELYLNSGVTALTLAAAQLTDFDTITHQSGGSQAFTLTAAAAGTYSLAGKTITGLVTLSGSSGADTLTGSSGNDTINGNGGNDIIEGGAGNDTLNGNGDTDTLTYANAGSAITIDLSSGSAQSTGGAGTDTISNFENLTGSAYNDSLTGNSSANVILGGGGNDTITAAGGNDTLDGGLGTDSLIGGTGNDTYKLERTYGASEITENDSTGGNTDVLQLGADVARDQLWFTQAGNDLVVQVIGTGAQMTINDWYLGSDYQVEQIKTASNDVLSNSNVQNLVNAMSSLTVPDTTTLSPTYHTALDSTIAANWA